MTKQELKECIRQIIKEELMKEDFTTDEVSKEIPYFCIISKHGKDDFSCWSDFSLTPDEEAALAKIFSNHETEGGSIRGSKEDILTDLQEILH
jgi:hypothetical protein